MKTNACDSRNGLELGNSSRIFHVTNGRGDIVLFEPLRLSLNGCGYRQIELFPIDVAPL